MKPKPHYGSMTFEVAMRYKATRSVNPIMRDYKKLLEDIDKSVKKWVPKEVSSEANTAKKRV